MFIRNHCGELKRINSQLACRSDALSEESHLNSVVRSLSLLGQDIAELCCYNLEGMVLLACLLACSISIDNEAVVYFVFGGGDATTRLTGGCPYCRVTITARDSSDVD